MDHRKPGSNHALTRPPDCYQWLDKFKPIKKSGIPS